jgi:hypothetical protein
MAPITALFRSVKVPKALNSEAGPEQGQGNVVGQQLGVEVDPGQRHQCGDEQQRPQAGGGVAEMPGGEGEQRAGSRLRPADSGWKSAPRNPCSVRAATAS